MQLTDAGQQVLAAVRKVQRNQNRRTGQKRQSRLNSPVAPPRARRSPLVPSGDARN
jgi:hypothetical protein